jgi:hypothetical protein
VTKSARAKAPLGLLLAGLFVNFVFNGGIWVLAEQLGLKIPGTDPVWLSTFLAASMLFGLLGTAAAAAIAPRGRNLTSLIVGNALLVIAVLMLSGWRSLTGFVLTMALLNVAVIRVGFSQRSSTAVESTPRSDEIAESIDLTRLPQNLGSGRLVMGSPIALANKLVCAKRSTLLRNLLCTRVRKLKILTRDLPWLALRSLIYKYYLSTERAHHLHALEGVPPRDDRRGGSL